MRLEGIVDTALLATKLYLPPGFPKRVPRPRLLARLREGLACPLTLISAPAGFGKTTLLRATRTTGGNIRWLGFRWMKTTMIPFAS
jgi:LuxR family maltose regulon positive regulatory protein